MASNLMKEYLAERRSEREKEYSDRSPKRISPTRYAKEEDYLTSMEEMRKEMNRMTRELQSLKDVTKSFKMPNVFAMPNQHRLSIPVATDEGGTGSTTRPQSGQMPVADSNGNYQPGYASIPSGAYLYFGDASTDGSWRIYVSGVNLVIEKRESGSWVEKGSYLP